MALAVGLTANQADRRGHGARAAAESRDTGVASASILAWRRVPTAANGDASAWDSRVSLGTALGLLDSAGPSDRDGSERSSSEHTPTESTMKTFLPTEVPATRTTTTSFTVSCICGLREEEIADQKVAEVFADTHEARARVSHKHNTNVIKVEVTR